MMGQMVRTLLQTIIRHRLESPYPELTSYRQMCEYGLMTDDVAEAILYALQPCIREQERRFNCLQRPPSIEEIYPDKYPTFVCGHLVQDEEIPIGVFVDGPVFCLFAGTAGAGKTIAMRRLIVEVERFNQGSDKPIAIVVLDRKGGDYADLPKLLSSRWLHLDVHGALRLGLNGPSGIPPNVWINVLVTILCARAGLVFSWVTVANLIRMLLGLMNKQPGTSLLWPSWQLILDVAKAAPWATFSTKQEYDRSLIQVLEGMTQASGSLFHTFNGLDLERDVIGQRRSVVISMPNLWPPWLRQFTADVLVSQVLLGRIHRAQRGDRCDVLFVIDEADADVSRKAEAAFPDGMSPISQLMRMGRAFSLGLCLGLGSLGPVSRHVLSAADYHFVFKLTDAESIAEAARTLLLPPGAEAILPGLEPGECLVRQAGRWPHAMLGRINEVLPCRDAQPSYDTLSSASDERLSEMPKLRKDIESLLAQQRARSEGKELPVHAALRAEARKLLYAASQQPYVPVARLFDMIGKPTFKVQEAIRKELEDAEYACFQEVRLGSRNTLLIELTDKAWSLLGKPPIPKRGRGGLAHRTAAQWLVMVGKRRGHRAECEWVPPGSSKHPVDAAWEVNGAWEVFEVVVTSFENIAESVDACLVESNVVSHMTIVVTQKGPLKAIRDRLSNELLPSLLDRIRFETVDRYLKELWP